MVVNEVSSASVRIQIFSGYTAEVTEAVNTWLAKANVLVLGIEYEKTSSSYSCLVVYKPQ